MNDVPFSWSGAVHAVLQRADVQQAFYVPDAGLSQLIELLHADPAVATTVLTTEQEGVAMAAGAWLGGQRAVLLMQSSGVGNCVNMLSLLASCRFPLLALVTMRGEWAEFNPWQVAMGSATPAVLASMGVTTLRVDEAQDAAPTMEAAAVAAFDGDQAVAVLLSQRMLGRKLWVAK